VIWPGNQTQVFTNVKANQRLNFIYSDAFKGRNAAAPTMEKQTFSKVKAPFEYTDVANTINDFKRQPLMLFMASKTAPVMARADVNKDGLEDLFIGGSEGTSGKLYLQTKTGTWETKEIADLNAENTSAAAFFDANGDGAPDLYVAKGGYALLEPGSNELQDKLYLNDGKGNFTFSSAALPVLNASSKSCVRPCDYNNDGKTDLFIGGRIVPGQYPAAPRSYLLENNGDGTFTTIPTPFNKAGMVTDAQWTDLNSDGRKDLVLCG
jgi:hypothetical protein